MPITRTSIAPSAEPGLLRGNGYVAFGDSISSLTAGAGYGSAWAMMGPILSNQRLHFLGNAGVSGNNTTQMLARLQADVIALAPTVVTVLGGTNDLSQAVSFATFTANITATVGQLQAARITPVLCTIPPRGNTTYLANTIKWNNWLRSYARANALPVLDFFALLVDPVTGMYKSGYDSGDALHPSPAAHVAMAQLVNTQLVPSLRPYGPPRALTNTDADNLLANPLLATGTPTPGSWIPGGTSMTGYTEALVTDSDFVGSAWEWNFTNPSNAAGFRTFTSYAVNVGAAIAVGDTLAFTARCKVVSVSGVTPGSNVGLRFQVSFNGAGSPTLSFVPGDAIVHTAGLWWFKAVVPASTTSVQVVPLLSTIPTTGQMTARVGEVGMFNLTKLALP